MKQESINKEQNNVSDNRTVDIILPANQLEGTYATLSKWLVNIGQHINAGDPLIELETDKVSMEICAPESGVLHNIIASEGEEIAVDTVLGRINTQHNEIQETNNANASNEHKEIVNQAIDKALNQEQSITSTDNSAHHLVGPAVRRLLKTHHLNIDNIIGSGRRGRVIRNDVLTYIANMNADVNTGMNNNIASAAPQPLQSNMITARAPTGTMVPHTNMRKAIANHMVESLLNTSPHVTSVFEMDMSNIIEHRKWHKKEYAELDVNLTFTSYFLAAVVKAAQAVPQVNARFHKQALELFSDINIGVGTALGDAGIVVPVVQQVQSLNLFGIAKALTEQTNKARNGKLTPSDMKHGTFTISNHGVSGSLFATPIIINQPQVAILGIGKLEKRVVVEEVNGIDTMVIKPKCYVSLSIDHRALDAHQTNLFLSHFVEVIENWGQ